MDFVGTAGVRGDVDKVNKSLRLFSDTLDEWVECQKKWLYLENIFMAPDIQRQLPNETKLFASVDRQFKSIMRITRDRPAALPVSPCVSASLCIGSQPQDIACGNQKPCGVPFTILELLRPSSCC